MKTQIQTVKKGTFKNSLISEWCIESWHKNQK